MLVAGVDCSTQSTKVAIVDADDGRVVASGSAPHEVTGADGARETDPTVWWRALRRALDETGRAIEVDAVSVAAQQHGLVVANSAGTPLRPAVLWNDVRSAPDAAELVDALGGPAWWAEHVGSVPVASFTATSWAWLRRTDPLLADDAAGVRLPHDWLTERLTGEAVTDRGDASGTGWWSTHTGGYVDEVLDAIKLDRGRLPRVLACDEPAGEVTRTAASELGLRSGIPVGPGTGDNMGAALGLGVAAGVPVMSLGTSGTAYAVMTVPAADSTGTVAGFADATGRYLPLACTLNATLAVDRMAAWLGLDRDAVEPRGDVVVVPWFDGERTPNRPDASASISGLRHATTPGQILMATYEGVVSGLLHALDLLGAEGSGLDPAAPLVLIGGGARGATWREVAARLSGRHVEVPAVDELVAYGAAAQAAAVARGRQPADVASEWTQT